MFILSTSNSSTQNITDPVGLWEMDGNAEDSSGNGHDGEVNNIQWITGGQTNESARFNEEDDSYIYYSNLDVNNSITIAAWIRNRSEDGPRGWGAIAICKGAYKSDGWYWWVDNRGWRMSLNQRGEWMTINSDYFIPNNEWIHLAAVIDNNNLRIRFYVNGLIVSEKDIQNGFSVNSRRKLCLGKYEGNYNYNWSGDMDDVRIYNGVLSANEISNLVGQCSSLLVWDGDYEINNQSDLDNLSCYTSITGALRVLSTNLENLDGLERLSTVGSLLIADNSRLSNINALRSLVTAGEIQICDNWRLQDLSGLSNLIETDGLSIDRGDVILNNLLVINGHLRIAARNCRVLEMKNLLVIRGNMLFTDDGNDSGSLENVNLSNLRFIGGHLGIIHQQRLQVLNLTNLTSIGDGFSINDTSLKNLSGLGNLTIINGFLSIDSNFSMTSLQLDRLLLVKGNISISENDHLPINLCNDLVNNLMCFTGEISIHD